MHFESTLFVVMGWKRAPFLRILVPLLAGICLQLYVSLFLLPLLIMAGISAGGILLFRFLPLQWRFAASWIPGVLIFMFLYCAGSLLLYKADIRHQKWFYGNFIADSSLLLLQINEPLQEKTHTYKTTAKVIAVHQQGQWVPVKGCLLLYFAKDSCLPGLVYGDRIVALKRPEMIKSSGNPGAFNYRQYCVTQQLYHQLYLRITDFYPLHRNGGNPVSRWLLKARYYCLNNLKQYIGNGPEAGMAEALLIGYRQDLDKDVVQAYSNTGIVHVIAISGMHLALLYGTLLWCLQWLPVCKSTNLLKATVILVVLWGFALLTGASASVLRSAVMFTGITTGRFILDRYSSIYNTLTASATVLLCFNPYLAIDAGFQLSYLAVLSILLFYPPVYRLWEMKRKWANLVWQMVALSLAAQLMTTPVSLFYFHQFPNYFLLANLIAVPLSTVIIYGEVILLLLAPFRMAAVWIGRALKYGIWAMNNSIKWLGDLPHALITNIHWSLLQTVFAYGIIAGLAAWWLLKWRTGGLLGLLCLWGCVLVYAADVTIADNQRKIIVYNVPAHTAIDCVEGGRAQFTGDDSIWQLPAAQVLNCTRNEWRAETGRPAGFQQYGHCISFHGKRLLIIDSALPAYLPVKKFKTDYILLAGNSFVDIKQLGGWYEFDMLIFAASNSVRRTEKWQRICDTLGWKYHAVGETGAFIYSFP
ncbi:ComEC/Rec2 family competence protein [Chitinophaga sp. 22321]|uniref:ComEC/Rec2 family competence protein n=1 Tax=Chitinophaga hostae TaxID=2831022 RepID=A0ABS5IZJ8_9BACT|nr:ComEC/Rec2 family competence protein [Chitinophaga hostae]MBS0028398.1 ComEC/Rec2 family competence protein [Chitinophaga hostae]